MGAHLSLASKEDLEKTHEMRVTPMSQKASTELNQLLESNTHGLLEHKLGDVPGLKD